MKYKAVETASREKPWLRLTSRKTAGLNALRASRVNAATECCTRLNGDFARLNGVFAHLNGDFTPLNGEFALLNADFAPLNREFALLMQP